MEWKALETPSAPRKNDPPMRNKVNQYCRYHRCKGQNTDNCKILYKDIESLIEGGFLKNFVARRERSRIPRRERQVSPRRGHEGSRTKKGTFNVISGSFSFRWETSTTCEVYTSQISGTTRAWKRPTEENGSVISISEEKMGHVTSPHEDALVITTEIDGYDVKRVLIDLESSTNVLFLDALKNMDKWERLEEFEFSLDGLHI